MEQACCICVQTITVRTIVVALLLAAVSILAWREQRLRSRVAHLEDAVEPLRQKTATFERERQSIYQREEAMMGDSIEASKEQTDLDRAQTAFALGQYEYAVTISTNAIGSYHRKYRAPDRFWRIVLASTCALKQPERARGYALNRMAIHDPLVEHFCGKNHIKLPEPLLDGPVTLVH